MEHREKKKKGVRNSWLRCPGVCCSPATISSVSCGSSAAAMSAKYSSTHLVLTPAKGGGIYCCDEVVSFCWVLRI